MAFHASSKCAVVDHRWAAAIAYVNLLPWAWVWKHSTVQFFRVAEKLVAFGV
jgi:hypothetical protein